MKKLLSIFILSLLLFSNVNSEERDLELNKLFNQLKNNSNASMAFDLEIKIWNIWSTHPSQENLTQLLADGSNLMTQHKLNKAY